MYPSTEMLISAQKYKLQNGKISPILSTQITAPVKKNINLSVQKHKFQNKHIHRLCDYILEYSKIHVYNSTTIFIPVQKYKSQSKIEVAVKKKKKKNGTKNITTIQQCVSQYRNINFSTKKCFGTEKYFLKNLEKIGRYFIYDQYYVPKYICLLQCT